MKSTSRSSAPSTVVIALGTNLGDRALNLRRAIGELRRVVHVVRISPVIETAPVGAPRGSPDFLNMAISGWTHLTPLELLRELMAIEQRLGRVRGWVRNAPRVIDLDLILHSAHRMRTRELTLPHPRAHERAFVLEPLRAIGVPLHSLA